VRSFPGPRDRFAHGTMVYGKNARCIFGPQQAPLRGRLKGRSYRRHRRAQQGERKRRSQDLTTAGCIAKQWPAPRSSLLKSIGTVELCDEPEDRDRDRGRPPRTARTPASTPPEHPVQQPRVTRPRPLQSLIQRRRHFQIPQPIAYPGGPGGESSDRPSKSTRAGPSEAQQSGGFQNDRGTNQPAWAHQERADADDQAIRRRLGERFRERLRINSCCLTSTNSATTERARPSRRVGRLSSAGG
jgi:hypothetical protein